MTPSLARSMMIAMVLALKTSLCLICLSTAACGLNLNNWAIGQPDIGSVTPQPSPTSDGPQPVETSYALDQAKADIEVILVDRGKAYLEARRRLEQHPELAAEAVMARFEGTPAPGAGERDRMLNVLAALVQPEHVALFGEHLRIAMLGDRPTQLWTQVLRRQGAAATPVLLGLVGDMELSKEQRGELLDLLVDISDHKTLNELLARFGGGSNELQDTLQRALIRRARHDTSDDAEIITSIDAAIDAATDDPQRLARLVSLRAAFERDRLELARLARLERARLERARLELARLLPLAEALAKAADERASAERSASQERERERYHGVDFGKQWEQPEREEREYIRPAPDHWNQDPEPFEHGDECRPTAGFRG